MHPQLHNRPFFGMYSFLQNSILEKGCSHVLFCEKQRKCYRGTWRSLTELSCAKSWRGKDIAESLPRLHLYVNYPTYFLLNRRTKPIPDHIIHCGPGPTIVFYARFYVRFLPYRAAFSYRFLLFFSGRSEVGVVWFFGVNSLFLFG